jgi:hypothetical protein
VLTALAAIVPETDCTHILTPVRQGEQVADLVVLESDARRIPWKHAPTGLKQLVFLLSLVIASDDRSTIFIEEPECNLHPLAIRLLMQYLYDEVREHEKQVVLATHSLDIVDSPGWSKAFVFSRKEPMPQSFGPAELQKVMKEWWDVRRLTRASAGTSLLLLEGRDDEKVWSEWLRKAGQSEVRPVARGGIGAVGAARAIKTFNALGVSALSNFVLVLDGSSREAPELGHWFEPAEYYVCRERDITGYLLNNSEALARGLGLDETEVQQRLSETEQLPPKDRWRALVERAGRTDSADLKGRVAHEMKQVPEELSREVLGRFPRPRTPSK